MVCYGQNLILTSFDTSTHFPILLSFLLPSPLQPETQVRWRWMITFETLMARTTPASGGILPSPANAEHTWLEQRKVQVNQINHSHIWPSQASRPSCWVPSSPFRWTMQAGALGEWNWREEHHQLDRQSTNDSHAAFQTGEYPLANITHHILSLKGSV